MYEHRIEEKVAYYLRPEHVANPHHISGFNGTFAFSSHDLIPEVFHGFIQRYFGSYRIRRVPLDKINEVLNDLWEGPGSIEKILRLEHEMQVSGKDVKFTAADIAAVKAKKASDIDDEPLAKEENEWSFDID